jgi:hypothetical protein
MFRHSSLHIASRGPRIALISAYGSVHFKPVPSGNWGYPVETRGALTFREHHNQKNSL